MIKSKEIKEEIAIVNWETVENMIYVIRSQKVMTDISFWIMADAVKRSIIAVLLQRMRGERPQQLLKHKTELYISK